MSLFNIYPLLLRRSVIAVAEVSYPKRNYAKKDPGNTSSPIKNHNMLETKSIQNIRLINRSENKISISCHIKKENTVRRARISVSMVGGALKKKKLGKLGPAMEKKILPVETDPERLVNYVCGSNINKTGEDVKLLPDSEYPDWLWNIRTGPPPPIEELDRNTKQYWRRIRRMGIQRNNQLAKLKKF